MDSNRQDAKATKTGEDNLLFSSPLGVLAVNPPGNVLAVGVDLADVGRIRDAFQRHGERFARRILSPKEAEYCLSRPDPAPHIAARFAAKEAVVKCLGGGCALGEIEVVRALTGFPSITLSGRAAARAQGRRVLISLSHLDNLAAAFAVLVEESAPPAPVTLPASEALRTITARLIGAGIPPVEARNEARLLVLHSAGLTPESLRLRPDQLLSPAVVESLRTATARRERREPLAYILGEQWFYGLHLTVTAAVLVPRPETEFVVETVAAYLADRATARVVDVGTGSGAIAVAVAHSVPSATVCATDISAEALAVARQNVAQYGMKTRVILAEGDLLAPVQDAAPFDVIASNPPYIAPPEIETLQPEVRDWEPRVALGIHADALHFYRRLAREAPPLLVPGGLLVVEVGQGQAESVAALFREAGLLNVTIRPDYAGIGRVVSGVRPG